MTDWNKIHNEINEEINKGATVHDRIRRKYLGDLHELTKRNVILYYSGWLQKSGLPNIEVNDEDKTGFMSVMHDLDPKKGLDLFLHTPGGNTAATESLVTYLKSVFGNNIRVIVPELAMSAGTMIACASKEIVMGKHSSLGPIDPQFNGIPAHGVLEEFDKAAEEIKKDPAKITVWQPIIAKYHPTFIGECEKAISWSEEMVTTWLKEGMFKGDKNANKKIKKIVKELGDHSLNKSHSRHLSAEKCKEIGLNVIELEKDEKLRNAVLAVHHATIHTLSSTPAFKIIENHAGKAFVKVAQPLIIKQ